jgi:glycosyltransferase involved in cell wall biosynthesis
MKLIVQIPCLNEEETLPRTLRDIPRKIPGIDKVEILVIDDGSTDRTVEIARKHGADHIVRLTNNKGLAEAFMTGLNTALQLGADIIVNTDGDNQYRGSDIPKLIQPILEGKADIVIGDRQIDKIKHFSWIKKKLQKLGSWVVRQVSNTDIPDATSGFRAFSREAALQINVISRFTYTLETIIQAGKKNLAITSVPVETNEKLRESRLFSSIPKYIQRSIATIFRIYSVYEPLKIFVILGSVIFAAGLAISLRFLYFFFTGQGAGHIQSLILAAVLFIMGFQTIVMGLMADLIGANRRLLESALYKIRKLEVDSTHRQKNVQKKEVSQ